MEKFANKVNRRTKRYGVRINDDKHDKNYYYHHPLYSDLVREFLICYQIVSKLDISQYLWLLEDENPRNKKYNLKIILSLLLIKRAYHCNPSLINDHSQNSNSYKKDLSNRDLILIRGLAFDKKSMFYKDRNKLNPRFYKMEKTPKSYDSFFEKGNDEFLNKNSFHKYISNISSEGLKYLLFDFIKVIEEKYLYFENHFDFLSESEKESIIHYRFFFEGAMSFFEDLADIINKNSYKVDRDDEFRKETWGKTNYYKISYQYKKYIENELSKLQKLKSKIGDNMYKESTKAFYGGDISDILEGKTPITIYSLLLVLDRGFSEEISIRLGEIVNVKY